jgi:hypothetical protein
MTDQQPQNAKPRRQNERQLEFGGLRFDVYFTRDNGPTTRVLGSDDGQWIEMLRFDDFVGNPHYHAPASGDPIPFDRSLGEPLAWYVTQIREHLGEWLPKLGFEEVLARLDLQAISQNSDKIDEAMRACVPEGFVRVPGVGLARV